MHKSCVHIFIYLYIYIHIYMYLYIYIWVCVYTKIQHRYYWQATTNGWVKSHWWIIPVTHMNTWNQHIWICLYVSCYTCEYVKSTHMNMFICVMLHLWINSHLWMIQVTHMNQITLVNQSSYTYEYVHMFHVTHVNMWNPHIRICSYVSCHTNVLHVNMYLCIYDLYIYNITQGLVAAPNLGLLACYDTARSPDLHLLFVLLFFLPWWVMSHV